MAEEKKVVKMDERKEIDGEVETIDETKEENMISKAKTLLKKNKKKLLTAGAILVTGVLGYALGSKSDGSENDSNIIDGYAEEIHEEHSSDMSENSTEE